MNKKINVLLALMQLVIGGAETHVVELAKELKRRGMNVIVASNGGVYVKELEEAGIRHYSVPLHNKKPQNMILASKLLKKIIIEEKIDIVHSHARIPSFILNGLYKKMHFPFVTTAHWVFNTKYGLKYITPWGEKVVAVSEDIKKYLIDNYKIPSTDIRVTINGIDTDKFSPNTDVTGLKNEFNINDYENVIVYVSRLDESRSLVAKQLIEITPRLCKEIDNLRVVIVGGGDDFEKIKYATDKTNSIIERECITLAGPRTDINKFAALGKLFIGVSRSALEAMAAQKPVIIAGNEGYIGLFDEGKLDVGINTNFCCRGCENSTPEALEKDILTFFELPEAEKYELGAYGRDLIRREYSVERMASDTVKVYEWALSKNKEILISGYYGFKNNGDDALLTAIIEDINRHKESPNIVVLSADPKETIKNYNIKAINRFNIFDIIRHMKKAEILISGGGTLIQDRTSSKSLWYYLYVIKSAISRGLKVMLYSNGIGPLEREKNKKRAQKVLEKVDMITLRDNMSYDVLRSIGVENKNVLVTADPAFNLARGNEKNGHELLKKYNIPAGKKLLGISVRKMEMNETLEIAMAKAIDSIATEFNMYPVFMPMQESKDIGISRSIASKLNVKYSVISGIKSVEDMMDVVSVMHLCIGMRLHMLTYSAINHVPLIGIVCDPKIEGFMNLIDQNYYLKMSSMTEQDLIAVAKECIKNYDVVKSQLSVVCDKYREQAELNGKIAIDIYEKGSADVE